MTDGNSEDEETVRVVANVPKSVKETAKQKLEYGGISREVQETLERIAFGEELTQRSRLERQREELEEKLRQKREKRRELDAEIDNMEQRIGGIDSKLSNITTKEDKFEAKLEELEAKLRHDGVHLDPTHPAVERAAGTGSVEPEGVIKTLKDRNPDVPSYAFEKAMHAEDSWNGLPESQADLEVDERG